MFSLYIMISHKKLLKKSNSINEKEVLDSILPVISSSGGIVSEYSEYFSYFPAKYEYSKETFILCLQNIHKILSNFSDLIGFSIIVDNIEPLSEFEYSELSNKLFLKTMDIDKIWFTNSAYDIVSNIIKCTNYGTLNMVSDNFHLIKFTEIKIINNFIEKNVQSIFDSVTDRVVSFNSDMHIALYRNLTFWAETNGYEQVLYLDFGFSPDKILTFIDFIISLKNIFDPTLDLTDEEIKNWGRYLDLYNQFYERSYNSFIVDDSNIHFDNLIMLWAESFSKRFKTLFIIKDNEDTTEIQSLWSIISLFNNVKLFIFIGKSKDAALNINLPEFFKLEDLLDENLESYLNKKNSDSLMVLYLSLLTGGNISKAELLYILQVLDFNILTLREELDNYKRLGFLLGDTNLYSGSDKIITAISNIRKDEIKEWENSFLQAFIKVGYHKIFSYSYTFVKLAINSEFRLEALDVLYHYIEKVLDLCRFISIPIKSKDFIQDDRSLEHILQYKKIRENRLIGRVESVYNDSVGTEDTIYDVPLEYLDLLNIWSENSDKSLIDRCKKLYFSYQTNGQKFNESRIKTLFSLSLLSTGSVGESVEYFDLNCNFSKQISDTYGYLRNSCFYCISLFIKGDISSVLRLTELLLSHNWIYFKSRWFLYAKFIRVRALIELTHYSEALDLLDSGIILAKKFGYTDVERVYVNWKGRVLYYLGREGEAREILLGNDNSIEANFFLAEIEYYSNDLQRALFYIEKIDLVNDDTVLFDENIKWRDGFFLIEEFFDRSGRTSILFQEVQYFSYMLKILNNDKDALEKYYEIINKISNNSIGIHEYRYIYYLYSATKDIDVHDNFNRDNLLNKVTRLLHQRASNIAEHNQKHIYLDNFYNRRIIEISRSKKLF